MRRIEALIGNWTVHCCPVACAVVRERCIKVSDAAVLVQKSEGSRAIGQRAAHAHGNEFEPLQHEQMVTGHLRAHARITWAQVVELCPITLDRAKRMLQ